MDFAPLLWSWRSDTLPSCPAWLLLPGFFKLPLDNENN